MRKLKREGAGVGRRIDLERPVGAFAVNRVGAPAIVDIEIHRHAGLEGHARIFHVDTFGNEHVAAKDEVGKIAGHVEGRAVLRVSARDGETKRPGLEVRGDLLTVPLFDPVKARAVEQGHLHLHRLRLAVGDDLIHLNHNLWRRHVIGQVVGRAGDDSDHVFLTHLHVQIDFFRLALGLRLGVDIHRLGGRYLDGAVTRVAEPHFWNRHHGGGLGRRGRHHDIFKRERITRAVFGADLDIVAEGVIAFRPVRPDLFRCHVRKYRGRTQERHGQDARAAQFPMSHMASLSANDFLPDTIPRAAGMVKGRNHC